MYSLSNHALLDNLVLAQFEEKPLEGSNPRNRQTFYDSAENIWNHKHAYERSKEFM